MGKIIHQLQLFSYAKTAFYRSPIPLQDLLHMLPTNETLVATREVIDEQIDKRIEELEREKYWDWQPADDSSGKFEPLFYWKKSQFLMLHN